MTTPAAQSGRRMRVAEFLAWDDGTSARYGLVDGQPVAINPPPTRHADIGCGSSGPMAGTIAT